MELAPPQTSWVVNYKTLLLHMLALGLGVPLLRIGMYLLAPLAPYVPEGVSRALGTVFKTSPWIWPVYVSFCRWLTGLSIAPRALDWLLELWPDVEFDFGLEHLKLEKMRRQRLWLVFSLVGIPVLLQAVWDWVTYGR